ncbi:MAG TPA: ABC transporter permease [Candidatus Limnocylindrales bacterium]|jgi:osmoprotectant transport system permease protein|nr:ABC transporter permease [Candidatus Limnocylindrales bacterium]
MAEGDPLIRFDWLLARLDMLAMRTLEHVWLTVLAVGIGFAISFALALVIRRQRRTFSPITAGAAVVYTIPSLALFAILVPITGRTLLSAVIALVGYTLFILVRNIVAALDGVPAEVRESATAMGYSSWARLWRIELPLALPVIVAGLRIATVTTIGLVTVAALIGIGGLGFLIENGLRQFFPTLYIAGAVLSVALAVLADALFVVLQRLATPWARARAAT